jgi:predicted transcriptional regulator
VNKHNRVKAREVMSQSFIQLDRMQTTREALKAMRDNNTEVIIVKKRDRHDAYGILLLSDITKKVLAQDRSLDRVNIYEVMSKPVVSVPPEMDVRYCARLFERFGLSCTPVIESEEILGLIGYRELFDKAYLNIE